MQRQASSISEKQSNLSRSESLCWGKKKSKLYHLQETWICHCHMISLVKMPQSISMFPLKKKKDVGLILGIYFIALRGGYFCP